MAEYKDQLDIEMEKRRYFQNKYNDSESKFKEMK